MSTITATSYPFDPTGTKVSNKITGEQQILSGANPRDYYFIVPKVAPFFEDSLSIVFVDSVTNTPRTLDKNIDYYCSHPFVDASYSTAKPIWGSISFLNTALVGKVTLVYNTVGGGWVPSDTELAELLANRIGNPRVTSWEQLINLPNAFPVIDHEYSLIDLKGMEALVTALNAMTATIAQRGGQDLASHKSDKNNPHGTTAAQLDAPTNAQAQAMATKAAADAIAAHVQAYHT